MGFYSYNPYLIIFIQRSSRLTSLGLILLGLNSLNIFKYQILLNFYNSQSFTIYVWKSQTHPYILQCNGWINQVGLTQNWAPKILFN